MPSQAAIALDIDGTITTGDANALRHLMMHTQRIGVAPLYVNTARDQRYCDRPDVTSTALVAPERSFCRPVGGDAVEWKIRNMHRMVEEEGVEKPECAVLIDDRMENIAAVRSHGFTGVLVDPTTGVTDKTVHAVLGRIEHCLDDTPPRH